MSCVHELLCRQASLWLLESSTSSVPADPGTLPFHVPAISPPAGSSEQAERHPEALQGGHRPAGKEGDVCLVGDKDGAEC